MGRPYYYLCFKKKQITDVNFRRLFYSNLALRDSCYQCEYAKMERAGDFTIGDAWGVKEKNPEFYDSRGVSLIMLNSEKAINLLPQIQRIMHVHEVELEDYKQTNMQYPSSPHRDKNEFWKDYDCHSFRYILEKYAKNNVLLNWRYIVKKLRRAVKCRKK